MAYIGNPPANRFVAPKAASVFSGDGSETVFTLEHAVGSDEDILVSVDGVIQEPSVAYAVSNGTTLTFTAAPSSNSGNNIFVYYLFRTVGTVSHPSNNALVASNITVDDITIDGSTISDGGDLTVDVAGDIILDADGSQVIFADGGTNIGEITNDGSFNFVVKSLEQDKDIIFKGNDGGTANTEVARFDVSETALVLRDGGGSQSNAGRIDIKASGSTYNLIAIQTTRTATGTNFIEFFNSSQANAGEINHNGSTTVNYSTTSDYRLKENVIYDFDATSRLKQLKPARFNFIADPDVTMDGFLAHEVKSIVPIAVNGDKDEIKKWNKEEIEKGFAPDGASEGDNKLDDDGNPIPKYQGIDNSHLVPLLVKSLQEALAEIDTLKTKVAALESK